jgi:hypothetical protein
MMKFKSLLGSGPWQAAFAQVKVLTGVLYRTSPLAQFPAANADNAQAKPQRPTTARLRNEYVITDAILSEMSAHMIDCPLCP